MCPDRYVAYERVSTARRWRSGLGLEAQRKAIDDFAATKGAEVLARFTEVERGRKADLPQLQQALTHARLPGATLVIAKLDRLSRNADEFARSLAPVIEAMQAERVTSLRSIADALNARGMMTRRGARWHVSNVRNLLARLGS